MKNTGKIFGIVVLVTVVLFAASCATTKSDGGSTPGGTSTPGTISAPSGTYSNPDDYTINFSNVRNRNRFVMEIEGFTISGTFTVSGNALTLEITDSDLELDDDVLEFTIVNNTTIKDDDGVLWKKQ